ncbi:MAG: hypothetical protein ACI31F_00285 [Muribaculaceae bacterium]
MPPPPPAGMGFRMPMFKAFVPEALRPWIYVLGAFCFQFSSGFYLGAMEDIQGSTNFMIEDVLMCLYANLAGMAVYFPLLFRLKFRFSNRDLLCTAAIVVAACNIAVLHTTNMPLLWIICFISGMAKLQGTFEHISNIQQWITPKRDFGVFFPVLHIILLTSIECSGFLAAWFGYHFTWEMMHFFTVFTMMCVVLVQMTCCVPFCPMPKPLSLKGIDFWGGAVMSVTMLMVSYIALYGDYKMWTDNRELCILSGFVLILTAYMAYRFANINNPYISPKVFTSKNVLAIWAAIILAELLLGCEHTVEEILYAEVYDLEEITKEQLKLWAMPGIYFGILFSLAWLAWWKFKVWKLLATGYICIAVYTISFYFLIDVNINIEQFRVPIMFRGAAYAILSIALMWSLQQTLKDLEHFFMGLSVFNIFHMYLAGAIGFAIYSTLFNHFLNDDISRYGASLTLTGIDMPHFDFAAYMDSFIRSQMSVAAKQIYGIVSWAAIFTSALFLLLDIPAIRNRFSSIPSWYSVGLSALKKLRAIAIVKR